MCSAAISAFTVPGQMRRRLGEPQLFPETAATASYILGATGLVIAALPFLVGVLSILAAGMG